MIREMIMYILAATNIVLISVGITFAILNYIMEKVNKEETITIDLSEAIRQAGKEKKDE